AHNVRIVGATIPPNERALEGTPLAGHHSPGKDTVRQTVNRWIREGGAFDAVLDVDALLREPARPAQLRAAMDSGDHLHPGDAGYEALAAAIDIDALQGSDRQWAAIFTVHKFSLFSSRARRQEQHSRRRHDHRQPARALRAGAFF